MMMDEIPKGLCQCGCGAKTSVPLYNNKSKRQIKGEPLKFLNGHGLKGSHCYNWKGGKSVNHGRSIIFSPDHPRIIKHKYVYEHILIAEKTLGKFLPIGAVIHHHTSQQLVICENQAYHLLLHRRQRAYEACGHANWRKCWICKQWDDPVKLNISKKDTYHKDCLNLYRQKKKSAIFQSKEESV
jgi:hypothetical protein